MPVSRPDDYTTVVDADGQPIPSRSQALARRAAAREAERIAVRERLGLPPDASPADCRLAAERERKRRQRRAAAEERHRQADIAAFEAWQMAGEPPLVPSMPLSTADKRRKYRREWMRAKRERAYVEAAVANAATTVEGNT